MPLARRQPGLCRFPDDYLLPRAVRWSVKQLGLPVDALAHVQLAELPCDLISVPAQPSHRKCRHERQLRAQLPAGP